MSLIRYTQKVNTEPYQIEIYEMADGKVPFDAWFLSLRDEKTKAIVRKRLARIRLGSFGDRKPVGEGVSELKIDFGPGFRIYYAMHEKTVVLLLTAGNKSSQSKDIKRAIEYWREFRSENNA
jgi:putative addiction module killer protein